MIESLWQDALAIWTGGGWAMFAIGGVALVMFGMGVHVWLRLRSKGHRRVPERIWRRWIEHPHERNGKIGELLDFVTGGATLAETGAYFDQLRATECPPIERDLRVMKICVSAAPLVGLLGTVTGMLSTFDALAVGSGGDKTMQMVASGISEALITTETGLVVALPGLFFQYSLSRGYERYRAFLAQLETVCAQVLHRRERQQTRESIRAVAYRRIAEQLQAAAS